MLASLKIENVAVIEKAEVNFTPGFNVLTGETGAGKSILIDSINAILGNRTSRELVRSGAQKACIWATFESIPTSVKKQLEKCGYEVTDDLLLYREINAEGKGSCRVNGMPATAAVVRDISSGLLSIHGQHDSQSLTNPALHLGVMQSHERDCSLDSASVLVGGVDDVGEHLGVGVAGAGDGIHTGEGETANHGILERHNVFLVLTCKAVGFAMCCCLRYETGCVRAASQGRGSASVLVGVVDDVENHLGVGVTGLG